MKDNSVDAIVTDPPYGLSKPPPIAEVLEHWLAGKPWKSKQKGFMGKEWDSCVPGPEYWREAFRVLKPGGHALIFAGSRTVDLMGTSVRLAGFEIRDQLQYLYGSGFPKSLDVSKAIDKASGHWRGKAGAIVSENGSMSAANYERTDKGGWGTALKPAHEPIILARKPFKGTVAKNVQEHGTGAINIDGCRIASDMSEFYSKTGALRSGKSGSGEGGILGMGDGYGGDAANPPSPLGRWPANVILDEEAGALLDEQSGNRRGMSSGGKHRPDAEPGMFGATDCTHTLRKDSGGASRFFYSAKASKKEKNAGLGGKCPHPTVKPLSLMRWLCRLVTPPGGLILDPFSGSGSTGCAAVLEGFDFVGCELSEEYSKVARARIAHWESEPHP